ncbi:hypothetical protein GCM10007423_43020 [Dyadobacter endophyticus]|uniref:Large polyvalent protein-associated domain-containing protein n=1 Tax=Dyadobacter endophyticus TaxID=1749036 RepID=A0ABQ1Z1D5_9BACT|nr:hypothetical protein [Dyadobacter endophyticus]GGH44659.1 hypothetical protein GCM10007423_43020 [Dyadobacter endophyticus]
MDLNHLRRVARKRVKEDLVAKNVGIFRDEFGAEIKFNMSGIKECINQLFNSYPDKLQLLMEGLEEALASAVYLGFTHPKEHVAGYLILKQK